MPKQLKSLLQENKTALKAAKPIKDRAVRHLMFTGNGDADQITLPLCGSDDRVFKKKTLGVTCASCKIIAEQLSELDTYEEAVALINSLLPVMETPDSEAMEERHGDMPSKKAQKHMKAEHYLKLHNITTPEERATNIIGSSMVTYFWNLVELDLIDEEGEPLVPIWE